MTASGTGATRGVVESTTAGGADEVRDRIVEAAGMCIARRGDAKVRMAEVAAEAGVARSTLYRYFSSRADLVLEVLLSRIDAALEAGVERLADPDDPGRSMIALALGSTALVEASPVNRALFSPDSEGYVTALELGSEPLVDAIALRLGPLLERWQKSGRLRGDLDIRETCRWLNTVALILLAPPWRDRTTEDKREFLELYVIPALVTLPD